MGFEKYTKAEDFEVLSPEENADVNDRLSKTGSASYADLPKEEQNVLDGHEQRDS